jgi:ATP-binding cassette, subfamily G (WHITE), member 2
MGLQATLARFLLFQSTLVLFNVAAGSISILVGVLARNVGTANLSATVVFLVMLLFGGFLLNSQTMPSTVAWLKHFSIFSYAFEILMTNELKGLLMEFNAPGYPSVPVYGDVFLKTLGMDYANRYYDLAALATIAGTLQVLAFLFLSLQVPVRPELVEDGDETLEDDESGVKCKGRSATMPLEMDEVKLEDLKKRPAAAKAVEETNDDTEEEEGERPSDADEAV